METQQEEPGRGFSSSGVRATCEVPEDVVDVRHLVQGEAGESEFIN